MKGKLTCNGLAHKITFMPYCRADVAFLTIKGMVDKFDQLQLEQKGLVRALTVAKENNFRQAIAGFHGELNRKAKESRCLTQCLLGNLHEILSCWNDPMPLPCMEKMTSLLLDLELLGAGSRAAGPLIGVSLSLLGVQGSSLMAPSWPVFAFLLDAITYQENFHFLQRLVEDVNFLSKFTYQDFYRLYQKVLLLISPAEVSSDYCADLCALVTCLFENCPNPIPTNILLLWLILIMSQEGMKIPLFNRLDLFSTLVKFEASTPALPHVAVVLFNMPLAGRGGEWLQAGEFKCFLREMLSIRPDTTLWLPHGYNPTSHDNGEVIKSYFGIIKVLSNPLPLTNEQQNFFNQFNLQKTHDIRNLSTHGSPDLLKLYDLVDLSFRAKPLYLMAAIDFYLHVLLFNDSSVLSLGEFLVAKVLDERILSPEAGSNLKFLLKSDHYRTLALWLKYVRSNATSKTKLRLSSDYLTHDYRIASVLIKHLALVGELDDRIGDTTDDKRLDTQHLTLQTFILNKDYTADPYYLLLSPSFRALLAMDSLDSSACIAQERQILEILRSLAYLLFDIPFDATTTDTQNGRHDFEFFDLRDCELLVNFWLTFTPRALPKRVNII